jgi:RNA polymerase sigma-70 factor (ECF subfamily)
MLTTVCKSNDYQAINTASKQLDQWSDKELTFAIIFERKQSAMKELYNRHTSFLLRIARRYLQDSSQAEDVVHDSFLDLWMLQKEINIPRRVLPWLLCVVKHKSIDKNRSLKLEEKYKNGDDYYDTIHQLDRQENPEILVEKQQLKIVISNEVKSLFPKGKSALKRYYFDEYQCSEIAEIEGCPVGTVKSRLFRAKIDLKNRLNTLRLVHDSSRI